ncbi:MAG: hypothetical protein ACLUVV_02225 [Christensenellales bacterium]
MSQAKQIETPYGNVWIEKIAFSRTREQLHIYAHTDKALSYAEFAKIQAHLILQTGQENTLVSLRMPISNEREIARLCVEYSKRRCVPVALFGVRAIGSTMKKRRSHTALLRKATSKM